MLEKLKDIFYLEFFQAREGQPLEPLTIPPNVQYIEVLTNGRVWFEAPGGGRRLYARGTLFWHVAGEQTIHEYPPGEAYGCYAVSFSMAEGAARPVPRVTCPVDAEGLIAFVERMARAHHEAKEPNPMAAASIYATLAFHALGQQAAGGGARPRPLTAALAYLEQHACQEADMETLARIADVSQDYLIYLFRKYLNTTPHQHVLKLRITRARQLLAGTSLAIKQVAVECGFNSTEVFYRQFLRLAGTTPARYRRQFQPA